jgi:hypothetical protein
MLAIAAPGQIVVDARSRPNQVPRPRSGAEASRHYRACVGDGPALSMEACNPPDRGRPAWYVIARRLL